MDLSETNLGKIQKNYQHNGALNETNSEKKEWDLEGPAMDLWSM